MIFDAIRLDANKEFGQFKTVTGLLNFTEIKNVNNSYKI